MTALAPSSVVVTCIAFGRLVPGGRVVNPFPGKLAAEGFDRLLASELQDQPGQRAAHCKRHQTDKGFPEAWIVGPQHGD